MKKFLASLLIWLVATSAAMLTAAYAQNAITLPIPANTAADLGNGPLNVRIIQGNASIFTAQGSGRGSTSGTSTALTLTATPATAPLVGAIISGSGITSGTTITAYNGTTGITLSANATVPASTLVAWGAACPSSAVGIPAHYVVASISAGYYLFDTQARVCAVSPSSPVNTLLILPVFYAVTSSGSGAGITALTGDVTASGPGSVPATLATVNANVGTFGSSTQCTTITVNGKGLITGASQTACAGGGAVSSVSNADGTLTISPTTGAVVASLALGHANTWLAQQINQGATTTGPGWYVQLAGDTANRLRVGLNAADVPSIAFGPGNAARDTFIERIGAGSLRFGTQDAAAPVAQILSVQNVVAGTTNTAGSNTTINGSQGTGTGAGGSIVFKTAPAGSTGTAQNALVTAMSLFGSGGVNVGAPTGGDKGAGTVNATGLYVNGTAVTGAGITALTGDVTASGPGSAAATLASTIVAAGPTGSATVAPVITFDAKGRLTAVSSATITPAIGSVTGLGTGVATALGNTAGGAGGFALASTNPYNLTGDVTSVGNATTLVNIPAGTTQAGQIVGTNIAAPSSPAAAHVTTWMDSTDLRMHDKNASGTIGTTVVADTGASNNFLTAISAAGVISKAQPTFANLASTPTTLSGYGITSPLPVAQGGTAAASASGTAVDNISGFASTGFLTRTGAGTYAFQSATNGITLGNIAQIAANTVLSNWTAGTANITANTWPSCAADGAHALTYTNGTGVLCTAVTGGVASSVTVGTTTVGSGTTLNLLYNNGGTLGNETIASILTAGAGIGITGTTNATITNSGLITITPQIITASATYTPTSGMKYTDVVCTAAGGNGGAGGASSGNGGGGGGGAGETVYGVFTAAAIGASKAVVIGAVGADTTFGSTLLIAKSGAVGTAASGVNGGVGGLGGSGGTTQAGNPDVIGGDGGGGNIGVTATVNGNGGTGGASVWGSGGIGGQASTNGSAGRAYGSGGGGGGGGASNAGGAGKTGVCVFKDFS